MGLLRLKGFSLTLSALCFSGIVSSQISINNTATADELAKSIMAPANIVVPGSVVLNCPDGAYGAFTNGTSDGLGIENGIILTTGQTFMFELDNISGSSGINNNVSGFIDADLQAIEPLATFDGCVIEFDIEPICERLVLDYIWGSDEYPEFVNGGYNDAFGFFVSGPGITGTKNIATVPGTTTLVSIDNVNPNTNSAYYVDNTGGNLVEYDGYTQDLSAEVEVVPCETYHLKIVCADAGDGIYDSGVLIAVNNPPCPINNINWVGIDTNGIEGCQDLNIDLTRTGVTGEPLDVTFEVLGTATDGVDYTFGLTDHTFIANDTIDSFHIPVLSDAIAEGMETITLIARIMNCSAEFSDTITININEGGVDIDTSSVPESCIGMCDGEATALGNGNAPFTYLWADNSTTSTITNLCAGKYYVTVTDANGCVGSDSVTVISGANNGDATITSSQDTFCIDESGVQLTAATAGGSWSGTGIDIDGNFNPLVAGEGTHTIQYEITGACGDTATYELVVNPLKDASINIGQTIQFCNDDSNYTYTSVNPGGTWSGTAIDANNGEFNPSLAGPGTHLIYYSLAAPCGNMDSLEIEVIQRKDPTISASQIIFCENETGITLTSIDPDGLWSGNGIHETTGDFDPAAASSGSHEIIYTITDFCGAADTINLTVNPMMNATILGDDTLVVCILDNTVDIITEVDSGVWDNLNFIQAGTNFTFDLNALGEGTHQLIYSLGDPCGDQDTVWLEIKGQILATITPSGPFCEKDTLVQVQGLNPGGTWSGNGIDAVTGIFNPHVSGNGIHDIIYTTPGNCGHIDTIKIEVIRFNDPSILITDTLICDDFGDIALSSTEPNGIWEVISGSTSGLDTANQVLNTVNSGNGVLNLVYQFGGVCSSADTISIDIQGYPDPVFDTITPLCENWSTVSLNPTTIGGLFTGTGVVGTPQEFDPATAGVGVHNITYTVGNLCVSTSNKDIEVLPQLFASIDPVAELCVTQTNQVLTTSSTGGIWTGIGVTDSLFDASIAGGGNHTVYYEIADQCGDTAALVISVLNPIDATIIPPDPICEGFDSLKIETVNEGGTWSGSSINNEGYANTNLTEGKYNIVYSFNSVCASSDSIEFEVLDVPHTDFVGGPRSGCIPLTVGFFDVSDSIAVNTYWDFGNGESASTLDTSSITYYDDGCYDITMYNEYSNGCADSVTKEDEICAYPLPDADFAYLPDNPDVTNQILDLYNLSTPDVDYWWDLGPEAVDRYSSDENPIAIYTLFGEDTVAISLNVMNVHGCLDSIIKKVLIEDIPTLFVPNSFTPNGDGLNDVFLARTNGYKLTKFKLLIYDRWGNRLFETNDPYQGWDGKVQNGYSGEEAQIDVYVWKIYFETEKLSNIPIEQVGTVSIIK